MVLRRSWGSESRVEGDKRFSREGKASWRVSPVAWAGGVLRNWA